MQDASGMHANVSLELSCTVGDHPCFLMYKYDCEITHFSLQLCTYVISLIAKEYYHFLFCLLWFIPEHQQYPDGNILSSSSLLFYSSYMLYGFQTCL